VEISKFKLAPEVLETVETLSYLPVTPALKADTGVLLKSPEARGASINQVRKAALVVMFYF
jgi:hypothetical protein